MVDKMHLKLENVVIATHYNLRPPDAAPVLIRFDFVAHGKFEVAQPIRCRLEAFLLLNVTLRCDLEL